MPSGKKRAKRVRLKLRGITRQSGLPRLTVFRSNRYIYAQIIDDQKGETLLSVSEKETKMTGTKMTGTKTERAKTVGQILAERAQAQKIKRVIFDRGSYKYHGRVKALAEGAREGGLNF